MAYTTLDRNDRAFGFEPKIDCQARRQFWWSAAILVCFGFGSIVILAA